MAPSTEPVSSSTTRTTSLSLAIFSKSVRPLAFSSSLPHITSALDEARMARDERLIAACTSSSVGDIVTFGMVSSTLTSKNGRSTYRKPPDAREPTRFFTFCSDDLVALSTAR